MTFAGPEPGRDAETGLRGRGPGAWEAVHEGAHQGARCTKSNSRLATASIQFITQVLYLVLAQMEKQSDSRFGHIEINRLRTAVS